MNTIWADQSGVHDALASDAEVLAWSVRWTPGSRLALRPSTAGSRKRDPRTWATPVIGYDASATRFGAWRRP